MSASVWAQAVDSLEEIQHVKPITEVHIDGLAIMKIVKHCNECLPKMVAGSLLGIDSEGVLDVTYSYPFPAPKSDSDRAVADNTDQDGVAEEELDGQEYQMEMMKMLREVNVDNNTVGWYQSMYLGTMFTNDVVAYQFSYQSAEELSDNTIVLMYDPMQSARGALVVKAFRLSDSYIHNRRNRLNVFLKPTEIMQELPVVIKNAGHVSAFIRSIQDTHRHVLDCDFDPLSMKSADTYTERHLEMMSSWLDELIQEQHKFHQYSKLVAKTRQEHIRWVNKKHAENLERLDAGEDTVPIDMTTSGLKPLPEAPSRLEPALYMGQLGKYCKQVNQHVDGTFHKLFLTSQLHSS